MTFTPDSRSSSVLTKDSRSANATFTVDGQTGINKITWGNDRNTWATELHTWAQMISSLSLDVRH